MNRFNFWYKWLLIVSAIMIALGMFITFCNQTSLFYYFFNKHINFTFWGNGLIPTDLLKFQSWIYSVLGATLIGWGIFLLFIIHYSFKRKQKWAWTCILFGICFWYTFDTTISISFAVYFNVAFNTILFIAIILPLFFTRKYFTM
jgi:hypothetical protein